MTANALDVVLPVGDKTKTIVEMTGFIFFGYARGNRMVVWLTYLIFYSFAFKLIWIELLGYINHYQGVC